MIREERLERMSSVLAQRIGHVHLAVETLYHRHNVSAVLRTCDALGLHHVHLVERRGGQRPFRVTKGAARGAERWLGLQHHATPGAAVAALKAAGCALWVADLADDARAPQEVPIDRPICLWFGAELAGVGEEALAAADGVMTIPMRGFAQSLNVSVAVAIALSTVVDRVRQQLGDAALIRPEERRVLYEDWVAREHAMRAGIQARQGSE